MAKTNYCIYHKFKRKKVTNFLPYDKCLQYYNNEDKVFRMNHKIISEKDYNKLIKKQQLCLN